MATLTSLSYCYASMSSHSFQISKGPTSVYDRVDLQQAEDIEEVFNRLALHPETIRRAPVRNTEPDEARSEKTGALSVLMFFLFSYK